MSFTFFTELHEQQMGWGYTCKKLIVKPHLKSPPRNLSKVNKIEQLNLLSQLIFLIPGHTSISLKHTSLPKQQQQTQEQNRKPS